MKNYNKKLLKLSKHMAKDNIQTARDTATRLTRPSNEYCGQIEPVVRSFEPLFADN